MKQEFGGTRTLRDLLAVGAILAACNLVLPGCDFDASGVSVPRLQCDGALYQYGAMPNGQPGFGIVKSGSHPTVKAWKPFQLGVHLYGKPAPPQPWKPGRIPIPVKGSYLLQVHRDDRIETQDPLDPLISPKDYLLKLGLKNQNVDGIWIAYDKRAISVPNWLSQNFQLPTNFEKFWSTINDKGGQVKYWIWEPKNLTNLLQDDLLLGGNDANGVVWKDGVRGQQYLVLVRMKVGLDTTKKTQLANKVVLEYYQSNCNASSIPSQAQEDAATQACLQKWVQEHTNYKDAHKQGRLFVEQDDTTCTCVEKSAWGKTCFKLTSGDGSDRYVNSWMRSSIGAIDSYNSKLTVEVVDADTGTVTGSGVAELAGEIEFRIDKESNVQIGELTMFGKDVTLSDGTTSLNDISIGQEASIVALCDDGLPPGPFRLCNDYLVPDLPEPGFQASAFCRIDGNELAVELENTNPMPLQVDLNTMTFLMVGGPLEGSFWINDVEYVVRIQIDMGGHFTSLAPVASVAESAPYWECGDGGIANVFLDASASDDELHPGTTIAYRWVEDAGALTETVLGTTEKVTVPMVFGFHDLTLYVQDSDMIWNSIDFEVEVGDSKIDNVNPPSDIWTLIASGSGGASVNIGQASGDDICSGQVEITNDANPSGWYPEGLSVVTWRFDDFNGNIVDHPQKIFLVEPQFYPPPLSMVFVLSDHVGYGQLQEISHETQSQGLAVVADEYVMLYGPDEFVASIASGEIIPDQISPHATDASFGAEPTFETVFEGVFSEFLSEHGVYTVETSLVKPGGDPREPADVIARDWASFSFGDEW